MRDAGGRRRRPALGGDGALPDARERVCVENLLLNQADAESRLLSEAMRAERG